MATKTKPKNRISDTNGKQEEVAVPMRQMDLKEFDLPIKGTSSLIVHQFSEKARKQIEDKQGKKAKTAKEKRDPKAEYHAAFYMMPGSSKPDTKSAKYGIPAAGFKNAAVSACTWIDGMTKVNARGVFHVMEDAGGLIQVHHKQAPKMRTDTVRIGMGTLDLRYRPEFVDWACVLRIRYNASAISPEQIVNMFNIAGFGVGMCEWRPERNGSYGMFEVTAQ